MKNIIAFVVAGLIATSLASDLELSEGSKVNAEKDFEDCIKEEQVPEADVARLHNKDFVNPSASMICFGGCFSEKIGAFKDNKVQADMAVQKLSFIIGEKKANEVLTKCKNIKGADRCNIGFKIYECIKNNRIDFTS